MEGAKNAYRAFQEVRRADTPNQGLSGRQELRQPPAKPICTVQAATRLVGGRRPSVLQRWGSGVLPRRFPVALKALPEPWLLGRFGVHSWGTTMEYICVPQYCSPSLYPIGNVKICTASFRLNARTSRHMGFCFGWTPPQNPKGQRRPHRRALRATQGFETVYFAYSSARA